MRCALLLSGLAFASGAAPQTTPSPDGVTSIQELEAILVTGERPGPGLWKVTNRKGNALWILPMFGPLPDGLVLRSTQLEAVIRESQAVFFLTGVVAPAYAANDERTQQAWLNVDSKFLPDVMPAELYAQFEDLQARYGNNNLAVQMYRPLRAAGWLKEMAMQRLQLTSNRAASRVVYQLAQQHGVPTFSIKMKQDEVWDRMIAQLDKTPREDDAPCVKEKLDRLEKDLQESVARANAWAKGDIDTLRQDEGLHAAQTDGPVCAKYYRQINFGRVQAQALRKFSYSESAKWLKKNRSTLALIPIADLFQTNGLISTLKRAGYKVEEPPSLSDAGQAN